MENMPKSYREMVARALDRFESVYQPMTSDEARARMWFNTIPYEVSVVASLLALNQSMHRSDPTPLKIASHILHVKESLFKPYRFFIVTAATTTAVAGGKPIDEKMPVLDWIQYRIYNGHKVILAHESETVYIAKIKKEVSK